MGILVLRNAYFRESIDRTFYINSLLVPNIPIWILASIYATLGIIVVLIGTKGFERTENLFAVMKVAAIFMFIILAILVLFGFSAEIEMILIYLIQQMSSLLKV